MSKIFEKLLEDFKRANSAAKEKLAVKFGFKGAKEYEDYLNVALSSTKKPRKKTEPKIEVKEEIPTDMVIAFDTTGSMGAYIAAVRNHVHETIGNLFTNTPNLKLKLVAFGDYCDMISSTEFGKAYQQTELTDSQNDLKKFVIEAKNTGGGDSEEFYELVLKKILEETPWREGSKRSILLIADAEPHHVGYSLATKVKNAQIDWKEEAKKAKSMDVKVDTLRIHSYVNWYQELSTITGGACMDFRSAEKTNNLVEATTYLSSESERGFLATKALYRRAIADGDAELVGAYKGMAKSRGINLDE